MDPTKRLRVTSDEFLDSLAMLATLEDEKRRLRPGDPRLLELAEEIRTLAARVVHDAAQQRDLVAAADGVARAQPGRVAPAIEETPRPSHVVLAEWRDAERRLRELPADSPEADALQNAIDRLRDEYQRSFESSR